MLSTLAHAKSHAQPPEVKIQPVFFFPSDQPTQDYFKFQESDKTKFVDHLKLAQNKFALLLSGQSYETNLQNSFSINEPILYYSKRSHQYFTDGLKLKPDHFHRLVAELLYNENKDRNSSTSIFVIIYMRPNDDGYFSAGGRTFNGQPGSGGGGVEMDIYELKSNPNFLSLLIHELGHAFGLVHVDSFGYDQYKNDSIMSYNPNNLGMTGSLNPEEYLMLSMNQKVFSNFQFIPDKHNPGGHPLNLVYLGAMDDLDFFKNEQDKIPKFNCQIESARLDQFTLNAYTLGAPAHVGLDGFYFIAGHDVQTNTIYTFDGGAWFKYDGSASSIKSYLTNNKIMKSEVGGSVFKSSDLTSFKGAKIYVGYGLGSSVNQAWSNVINTSEQYVLCAHLL